MHVASNRFRKWAHKNLGSISQSVARGLKKKKKSTKRVNGGKTRGQPEDGESLLSANESVFIA